MQYRKRQSEIEWRKQEFFAVIRKEACLLTYGEPSWGEQLAEHRQRAQEFKKGQEID
jgi:hypothetical protein